MNFDDDIHGTAVAGIIGALSENGQGIAGVAPGARVLTPFPHGTYNYVSGSSFAAANVSGVLALLLELKPGLSPDQAQQLLGGVKGDTVAPPSARINVCKLVARLRPDVICESTTRSAMVAPEVLDPLADSR